MARAWMAGSGAEHISCRGAIVAALLIAVSISTGCGPDMRRSPVPDTTMVDLLVEFHLANGRLEVTDQPIAGLRDSILQVYGVDSSAYATSIGYYARNPDEYSELYGRVLDRLTAERLPLNHSGGSSDSESLRSREPQVPSLLDQ